MKKIFTVIVACAFAATALAQNLTPKEVIAKCFAAAQNINYDTIKVCLSSRVVNYVDVAKTKIESPEMKSQKKMLMMLAQTASYQPVEEIYANDKNSVVVKVQAVAMFQQFDADVKLVKEKGAWKIDDVPNYKDIMKQMPLLNAFGGSKTQSGNAAK